MLRLTRQNRAHVLLVVVLFSLLVLMSVQVRGAGSNLLERTLFGITSPVLRLAFGTLSVMESGWRNYLDLRGVRRANDELSQRLLELEVRQQQLQQVTNENQRLRGLLRLSQRLPPVFAAARLMVNQAAGAQRIILVDQGVDSGVEKDMPVVVQEGIVGRVVRPGQSESVVELITDAGAAVAVRFERTGLHGMLAGRGGETLRLRYIPQQEDVREGDCLVTSGHDLIYPPGLPVGCVMSASSASTEGVRAHTGLMMDIEVKPAVSFLRLREVLILVGVEEDVAAGSVLELPPGDDEAPQ